MATSKTFILFFFFALIYYYPAIQTQSINFRDEAQLLEPLAQLNSVHKYWEKWKEGKILDVQPLRDLSYFLDISIAKMTGSQLIFYLSNFLFLAIIIFYFYLIALIIFEKSSTALITSFLLFFHPIWLNVVPWIASRKHLMSVAFFLIFLYKIINSLKTNRKIAHKNFFYLLLSWISHPITIFAPLGLIFIKQIRNSITFWVIYFLMLCFLFSINFWKYGERITSFNNPFLQFWQTLGQTIYQILSYDTYVFIYYPNNFKIISGIMFGLVILLIVIKYKFYKKTYFFLFTGLFVCSILPYVLFFYNDSYAILPLVSFFALLSITLQSKTFSSQSKFLRYGLLAVLLILTARSLILRSKVLASWENFYTLIEYNYQQEPSVEVKYNFAALLQDKNPAKALAIIDSITPLDLQTLAPYFVRFYAYVYCEILLANKSLSADEKIVRWDKSKDIHYIFKIYQSLFFHLNSIAVQNNQNILSLKTIYSQINNMGRYQKKILSHLKKICNQSKYSEDLCLQINLTTIEE